jgi:hypothetical protein
MMLAIKVLLGISIVYSFGMWLWAYCVTTLRGRSEIPEKDRAAIELFTFHIGICGIAAAGFLGVILALQGA